MVSNKLRDFLKKSKAKFEEMSHKEAFTAQQVAQAQHVSGNNLVKVVIIKHGSNFALMALPAVCRVELSKLQKLFPKENLRLATEYELGSLFPDCQIGAMPPFGNLYKLDTWADDSLKEDDEILFQSGDHSSTIKMKYSDWEKVVKPHIAKFSAKVG